MLARLSRRVREGVLQRPAAGFPALDGIRALAILMVVFFHATVWVELASGRAAPRSVVGSVRWFLGQLWFGVDAFFVLSGFLIGSILMRQVRLGRIDYRGFYVRRIARIFPAYYLTLAVAVVVLSRCATFAPLYGTLSWGDLLRAALKDALFLNNYLRGELDIVGWGWSLCVEEHFYLVLPLFLRVLFLGSPPTRLAVVLVLPLVPMILRAAAFLANPAVQLWDGMNFYSHTRCDGLLFGVLLAYFQVWHQRRFAKLTRRLRWPMLLVAVLCFGGYLRSGGVFRAGGFPVVAQFFVLSLGVAMIVARVLAVDDVLTRGLAHRFWYPIARVSYGMYLVHPFIALWLVGLRPNAAPAILGSPSLLIAFGAITCVCSLLVATVLFLAVELPMLRWGARVAAHTDGALRLASVRERR